MALEKIQPFWKQQEALELVLLLFLQNCLHFSLTQVLKSCQNYKKFKIKEGLIQRKEVERVFEEKFDSALNEMFIQIKAIIVVNEAVPAFVDNIDQGKYTSPNSIAENINETKQSCSSSFTALLETLGEGKLIIHVDDVQLFFKGVTQSNFHTGDEILFSETMGLALRVFSDCITPFSAKPNLIWVFSGTRPTLITQITLTSGLNTVDISSTMQDFNVNQIQTMLCNYYNTQNVAGKDMDVLVELCSRLIGPPKNTYFFLKAAISFNPTSIQHGLLSKAMT